MEHFRTIQNKLEAFIKKFYVNELIKGGILFFAMGLLYLLVTLFIEYLFWLSTTARLILFWACLLVVVGLFIKYLIIPLAALFKLRKGLNHERASLLIGRHFPEVNDKLINVLQLTKSTEKSELIIASIEQKSKNLSPIKFNNAVNFSSNLPYLKYVAFPIGVLLISWISGKINWFTESYERVTNYQTAYEPPAPFKFFLINKNLNVIENEDFTLSVAVSGKVIPENVSIVYQNESYLLKTLEPGKFEYTFKRPKKSFSFVLEANSVSSKPYTLNVVATPNLKNLQLLLQYPKYLKKTNALLKGTGNAKIPEGTTVKWLAETNATEKLALIGNDTLYLTKNKNTFFGTKRLFNHLSYAISTSNKNFVDYEKIPYQIEVVKDKYPELNVTVKQDTTNLETLYFYGNVKDDYGITKLDLVYYPLNSPKEQKRVAIPIGASSFSEFITAFPNKLSLKEGLSYGLYFQVFDNDALHFNKSTKSNTFTFKKLTQSEKEAQQLNLQNETIKNLGNTLSNLNKQDKKLEDLTKTQKEKKELNFNDLKKFEDFLKRQKQQEALMKNFNKSLQENLENFEKEPKKDDVFKEALKQRLRDNEKKLEQNEALLKELESLINKIDKEEFAEKLDALAKQNQSNKRSAEQLLELTKRYYITKKTEKLISDLEALSNKQEQLSKDADNNSKDQKKINDSFKQIQKDLNLLQEEDKQLKKPTKIPRDPFLEDEIIFDQNEAKKALELYEENKNTLKTKAQQQQQKAASKLKELAQQMKQKAASGSGSQTAEDAAMLRQILDNLLLFSFDQEALMKTFKNIDDNNNKFGKYLVKQGQLKEHFAHIDDSLFALSLRQPKLSEKVNTLINDVYYHSNKSLEALSENRIYQAVAFQQYTITATNELADFLSDVLDNMEMSMNPSKGKGNNEMQLPDIIMSQKELNEKMEKALQESQSKANKNGNEAKQEGEGKEGGKERNQGNNGQNGNESETENKNNEGKNSSKTETKKGNGYGEGGSEEQNETLYKIYQQQQIIKQALENRIKLQNGSLQSAATLIKQMEQIETELLNYGFTNQTHQKMMELQHQLLKLEEASFTQGEDYKRSSKTNEKDYSNNNKNMIEQAKRYFNATEVLNRMALPINLFYQKKIQNYFKAE